MLTEGEDAWILLLQKEKDPIMSMMMTSPIIKDPLTTLGYTTMEYFPKILSNPENVKTCFQYYYLKFRKSFINFIR